MEVDSPVVLGVQGVVLSLVGREQCESMAWVLCKGAQYYSAHVKSGVKFDGVVSDRRGVKR